MTANPQINPNHPSKPLTSAERKRASRARREKGFRGLWIEIHQNEIDTLVRDKRLKADQRDAPAALRTAIYGFFEDYLR
jgi:hypothetical protein